MSKAKIGGFAALLFVLLRLATGYHFLSEGVSHYDPNWTSAHFLRGATGPLANLYQSQVAGPYSVYEHLALPLKWDPQSEEPAFAAWSESIQQTWEQQRKAAVEELSSAGANEAGPIDQASRHHLQTAQQQLRDYLQSESTSIQEYRHELWRLEQMKAELGQPGSLPYLDQRIAAKEKETRGALAPWVAEVAAIEQRFHRNLQQLADGGDASKLSAALNPPTKMNRIDKLVTWVIAGAGALLLAGLMTRVAALVAAGFLLSVMASQPPWVYGADTTYFYYQLVELVALLLIAVVGAGRWVGFDGMFGALFYRSES